MRKPKTGQVRIPSPFDTTAWTTERAGVGKLMHWMRQIMEKENLDLGPPDVDTSGADRKSPDIVIYESRRSRNVLCVIEAKPPYYDVLDYEQLKKPAWDKANNRRARYFATTNFQELIWFNTEKANALKPAEEQVVDKYHLSELEDLNLLEETRYRESIIRQLEKFLTKLYAVYADKEPEPKQAIDEFLIYRLHDKIRRLARYYAAIIEDRCHKDKAFSLDLGKWFNGQGWSFAWQAQDFDKAARQTAYLLVNKILFYDLLQAKRPEKLPALQIPQGLLKGAQLQKILQSFFDEVLKIDYETIYTADFIDANAVPDHKEIISEIESLVAILREYDFSKLGYEIIGGIFQKIIPQDERHNLGQYFTNPDVVDLILCFCLKQEDDRVFDPSCGAGTFLVRAYQHKKLMNQYLKHEEILETLWGNDIAKFPTHLSTINLAINDLSVDRNYPNIMQEDFFNLLTTANGFELPEKQRRVKAKTLGVKEREIEYPRWFDCIAGNPPYTRQEEMAEIAPEDHRYKENTVDKALLDIDGQKIANISRRAGIYAYFFVHGTKFLRNSGRFGFVVSESWLDVDYGKGLQEFFLNQYKIIAIIGSKVERWFEDADINTCIIILEKCSGDDHRRERDDNLVRFVYLKKPLRYFIPPAQDIWEKQVARISAIKDKFIRTILAHHELYEGEDFRIFPRSQKELWEEGYDAEERKYTGAKWGKYLRAPDIFFKVLEKGRGKLVPLKQIAEVRFGIKTGANEFFYLTEEEIKRRGIEQEFWMHRERGQWVPNYVIKSPRECRSIVVKPEDLKYRVLMIHKDKRALKGTNVLKYIREGEDKGFHTRPTCASRERWYDLGVRKPGTILIAMIQAYRHIILFNPSRVYPDHNLFEILVDNQHSISSIAYLSSAITMLSKEIFGRTYGGGSGPLKLEGIDIERLPLLDPKSMHDCNKVISDTFGLFSKGQLEDTITELGINYGPKVSLDKVKPDRREMDRLIMGEILGLTDEEQLEVYRSVIDLVKSRLEKARSFGKRKKTKEGIDVDLLVKIIMEKIGDNTIGRFYTDKVLSQPSLYVKNLPEIAGNIRIQQSLMGWRLYSGKQNIDCASELEARYLKVWLETGIAQVKVPRSETYLGIIVPELETLKQRLDEIIASYLDTIVNVRAREIILRQLWMRITEHTRSD